MKVGTKSVLLGAHQFLWHPFLVTLAWRRLYKSWPNWWQLIAILLHDTPGYWGAPDIDGVEGKRHPKEGARLTAKIVQFFGGPMWTAYFFSLLHSRDMAAQVGLPVSDLYAPDKYCICLEPALFYLWRCRLTGELAEFKQHAIDAGHIPEGATDREWFNWYKNNVKNRKEIKDLL